MWTTVRAGDRAVPAARWCAAAGAAVLAVVLCGWAVAALARRDAGLDDHVIAVARDLASGLFLTAGILRLVRWRLTGDPYSARAALSLFAMGTALPGSELLAPVLHPALDGTTTPPDVRAVFLAPAMLLLAAAPRSGRSAAAAPVSPRLGVAAGAVSAAAVAGAVALVSHGGPDGAYVSIEVVAAAVWTTLAVRSGWLARRLSRPPLVVVAAALALMALSEAVRAVTFAGVTGLVGLGSCCQLAAASVVSVAASVELRATVRATHDDTLHLARALTEARARLARLEQEQRARLHDARSAVVGVIGASQLLSQVSSGSGHGAETLRRLMLAELLRLQAVLETDAVEAVTEFPLADVLRPVLLARRIDGLRVDERLGRHVVRGRPRATATAVDNLLHNVLRHAPGARVSVRVDRCGDQVRLTVDDDGPGIPPDERARVVLPGVRGRDATCEGSGLGLFLVATTMRGQGGTLELRDRPGGGTRVLLTLPAVAPDTAGLDTIGTSSTDFGTAGSGTADALVA